ncbi:hypothetical protein HYPSUDRAFT_48682 [Hypholoma sublateritium FD-334 SS-4]|uniref:AN1-type domain-containing protein n=1 Tax=Hypholoma sublateritium (strain FD-334 SS-4) TaxID=945553 RepID=A0A0D2N7I1_HYPSF|nr:hypothetical protein HYPSUDRAFT_48682 [Hypholoma sublateritium FD-334 SS-4]
MPPSTPTTWEERDTPLLLVGKECTYRECFLVDFLPLKCEHCNEPFCQDHFRVAAHHCKKYDAQTHDRVAPSCPLCSLPVSVRPGDDPDIRMDRHIETECSYMTGAVRARTSPICSRVRCKKVLFVPITCISRGRNFCVNHRFPEDHSCLRTLPPGGGRTNTTEPEAKRRRKNTEKHSHPASRRVDNSTPSNALRIRVALSSFLRSLPFHSVNRHARAERKRRYTHAKAERESKIKALEARSKKEVLRHNDGTDTGEMKHERNSLCVVA